MTDKATHMEARLMGLSKVRRKDGDWFEVRIQVHPQDMPSEMYAVPLGTRIGVAMVQIADDETKEPKPYTPKRAFDELPRSQQAGIRCKDHAFQSWLGVAATDAHLRELAAKNQVYTYCKIQSLTELVGEGSAYAAGKWDVLHASFVQENGLPEQR